MFGNMLLPMMIIKALEPDRSAKDMVLGGLVGSTIAGGNVVGGVMGKVLLDRMSPQDSPPAQLPPPGGKPDAEPNAQFPLPGGAVGATIQVPAVERLIALVETAAQAASQVTKDGLPAMMSAAVAAVANFEQTTPGQIDALAVAPKRESTGKTK